MWLRDLSAISSKAKKKIQSVANELDAHLRSYLLVHLRSRLSRTYHQVNQRRLQTNPERFLRG